MIYVLHRIRDDAVAGLVSDEAVHLLGDPSIAGMARGLASQFQQMECLSCVHLDVVANPVGERNRVLGDRWAMRRRDPISKRSGPIHHLVPCGRCPDVGDGVRRDIPMIR